MVGWLTSQYWRVEMIGFILRWLLEIGEERKRGRERRVCFVKGNEKPRFVFYFFFCFWCGERGSGTRQHCPVGGKIYLLFCGEDKLYMKGLDKLTLKRFSILSLQKVIFCNG